MIQSVFPIRPADMLLFRELDLAGCIYFLLDTMPEMKQNGMVEDYRGDLSLSYV